MFDTTWTRRAVIVLRNLEAARQQGIVTQARGDYGKANGNGGGTFCATQGLIEFLDALRNLDRGRAKAWIDRNLPITSDAIISLNDSKRLSFGQIADHIEEKAGGADALFA